MAGYPSGLTDEDWGLLAPFFARPDPRGNPGTYEKWDVINAILYVVKGGIPWRMLPLDFPPWDTVYDHYRRWNQRGVWEQALDALNERARHKQGKNKPPPYVLVDSQSVTTQYASQDRGTDGKKKIKGRKRHLATDTLGNMLTVQVHAANRADTSQGWDVCDPVAEKYDSVEACCGDQGYRGTTVECVENLLGLRLDIAEKPTPRFQGVPKRWIIERTLAWLGGFRHLAKDFEILTRSAENMIRIAMIKITVAKCV